MKSFQTLATESRRLKILQTLHDSPGYCAPAEMLHGCLILAGLGAGLETLTTDLLWLENEGLVATEPLDETLTATMTRRGGDVVAGLIQVVGVKRPDPGSGIKGAAVSVMLAHMKARMES